MSATATRNNGSASTLRVTEGSTYRRFDNDGPNYFRDLWASYVDQSVDATARLRRNAAEVRAHGLRSRSATQPEGTRFEFRAPEGDAPSPNPDNSVTPGTGGSFTPPLWLVQDEAIVPRPERVLSDLIGSLPLPMGVSSVNVPRLTTGTKTAKQGPNAPVADRDVADATTSSAATLLSGQEALPIQMIEQSPGGVLDQVLAADLRASYDADLESLLFRGRGGTPPFGEPLGLLNVPGVNSVTYTAANPSGTGLYPQLGLAYAAVTNTRKAPIQAWLLRGGRFAWLATSEDASNRPLDVPGSAQGFITDPTLPTPAGGLLNVPVFTDEVIPSTWPSAATGGNQDLIVGVRFSDFLLWESDRVITVDKESLSGVLGARFVYRGYAAAILGRQPSSIVTITGTGMAVQTGF